jgi:hypothetical protein
VHALLSKTVTILSNTRLSFNKNWHGKNFKVSKRKALRHGRVKCHTEVLPFSLTFTPLKSIKSILSLKLKATIASLFLFAAFDAQTVLNGHLTDSNKKPLSFAIISYRGTTLISDESGSFRITNYTAGNKIDIHKLGFADTTISVAKIPEGIDTLSLIVVLRLKITPLPEVSIGPPGVEEINPLRSDFVIGYELQGKYLIELLSDDNILIVDAQNKMRSRSKTVTGIQNIVKDPRGNLFLTTEKTAFKIHRINPVFRVDTVALSLTALNWNITYCDEAVDTSFFIRRYKDYNQTVTFFAVSALRPGHVKQLKEISDAERKSAVTLFANESNAFNQYVASRGLTIVTAGTAEELIMVKKAQNMSDLLEMVYSLPAYSFLKQANDSIYLFAHDLDTMFVYDKGWNLVKAKRINYHHLNVWDKELIVNEEKTKIYAKLLIATKPVIAQIDLQTGTLKGPFVTIAARFPSRIRIRNEIVYYMAKQKSGIGSTVYSQNIR